jgi:polysaccharide biosynthesis protein PslH
MQKLRLLQLWYKYPFPITDGGSYSICSAADALLANDVSLKILAMDPMRAICNKRELPPRFSEESKFESVVVDNRLKISGIIRHMFGQHSYFSARFWSEEFQNKLISLLKEEQYDIIQLEHLYLCQYIGDIRKHSNAKIVLRAQNVEHKVWVDYAEKRENPIVKYYLANEAGKLKNFEAESVSKVDGIIALTQIDVSCFKELSVSNTSIVSIPIGIRITDNDAGSSGQLKNPPDFFHLGSMDWRPNIEGMEWFIKNILPLAVRKNPDIRVTIAGRKMPEKFYRQAGPNLKVQGEVENSTQFMEGKSVLIVPLLSGSGMRVKILEAMSLGKTVISTSLGATGIEAVDHSSILICDDPEEFSEAMAHCMSDTGFCNILGENARKLICEKYEIGSVGRRMKDFYIKIMSQG